MDFLRLCFSATTSVYGHAMARATEGVLGPRSGRFDYPGDVSSDTNQIWLERWSGGGGNRTRVRGRTGVNVYKHRSPLKFALRPVCDRPTVELVLLQCRASDE